MHRTSCARSAGFVCASVCLMCRVSLMCVVCVCGCVCVCACASANAIRLVVLILFTLMSLDHRGNE